jgi:hypothetical protein
MNSIESTDKSKEYKKVWRAKNPDKVALYARNYYHKRITNDPEYKKKLCEKEKINKAKRENTETKKRVGRPLKYPILTN